ncbi:MAG: aldehyde dehydrogenase [Marinifilaceae bacterium]
MEDLREYQDYVIEVVTNQRAFYNTQQTLDVKFRIRCLKALHDVIERDAESIYEALHKDLHKSRQESYLTEVSLVLSEIKCHIENLSKWSKPRKRKTPLFMWPSKSYVTYQPLGICLILSPWNYPFLLLMDPLIGAIAAGNCAILKPSHQSPNINNVIKAIVSQVFNKEHVSFIEGNPQQTEWLLEQRFDFIFFTGSSAFGKTVMKAAAEHLTPVILELGGKSPCIVDKSANVDLAAKRIIWGKLINAGQTCVAPDYVFVDKEKEDELIRALKRYITQFYGENPKISEYYPRMISESAFNRVVSYLNEGDIAVGGEHDSATLYIAPTILRNITPESEIMREEIFGPILPIMSFTDMNAVINHINNGEKPLALYFFGDVKTGNNILTRTTSGGACINDVLMHIANHNLPFGGVGNSGIGKYHGYESFKAFSNERAVVYSSPTIDFPFKYVPFKGFKWIKRIL